MTIGVLGAGNGGQAFAGAFTLRGLDVHLAALEGHDSQIKIIQTFGGVIVEGRTAFGVDGGVARIPRVDTDVQACVANSESLILVVPGFAQEAYFDVIAEHAPAGQRVMIQPGKFGALRLAQRLRDRDRDPSEIVISETTSLLYAAKVHGLDHIWLRGVKASMPIASLPNARVGDVIDAMGITQLVPAPNVLFTSMGDPSYALHPVTTLLNLARLESMGPYRTHCYDITEQTGRMVEAVDAERCAVAAAFGVVTEPLLEMCRTAYGLEGDTVFEALSTSTVHRNQMTPRDAHHRYVAEEVPFGLVPLVELGKVVGLDMPATESIITLASVVNAEDYRVTGRHLASLGLAGLSVDEIKALV
jgi:opine dehydrogenase